MERGQLFKNGKPWTDQPRCSICNAVMTWCGKQKNPLNNKIQTQYRCFDDNIIFYTDEAFPA